MDVVWQGHWLVQQDIRGRIMSKPPLHTWAASVFAEIGGINRLTLALPSALAVLAMALFVLEVGRRRYGALAGGLAGLAVVLAPMMSKHIALVRTDALFALVVAAGAAPRTAPGRGGADAVLVLVRSPPDQGPARPGARRHGPAGLVWERRSDPATPRDRQHWAGIAVFLLLTLAEKPALVSAGEPLANKLFFEELVGQATGVGKGGFPGRNLPKPTLYFILRFLPFSLFALYGLWRIVRHPAVAADARRFERFLFCWIVGGIVLFSLASHHRGDAAAMAATTGREMARLAERIGGRLTGAVWRD
jgi:4-amino-4-deoxy-L-arabinose transferase-like glycosyltransferase